MSAMGPAPESSVTSAAVSLRRHAFEYSSMVTKQTPNTSRPFQSSCKPADGPDRGSCTHVHESAPTASARCTRST